MSTVKPEHTDCLSVVIPVYNEEASLAEVVRKLLALPHLLEVIIVDDCSTDRSAEVARIAGACQSACPPCAAEEKFR